ncbi:MAG: glycosyltransferase family 39 protein [Proteiniphilum sp.]|nr:glycosyltransferase family 39 protein [Proteiniphilum sp.]
MKKTHLFLIWFIALLPILLLRDFTPSNELRYLNIVDEALQNGNIFTFTNQGEIYADKPPLHFWLMMIGKMILGAHRMWYDAMLSFIPALVIIATMNKWIRRQKDTDDTSATLMLMTTGLFIGVGIIVRMDMLMNMFIVLSLYAFYQMYQGEALKRNSLLFPVFIFLALFSKGPLGILIPFVSTLVFLIYKKKLSDFPRYWGWKSIVIILSGCLVWFTGVYLEGGKEYIYNLLVRQTIGRGINAFHHKEPFYYYAITSGYALAPWSLLSIGLLVAGLCQKKIVSDLEQFFATVVLSSLLLLSVISAKLAIYSLPVIPFLIGLTILLLPKFHPADRWISLSLAIPAIVLILSLPAVICLSKTDTLQFLGTTLIFAAAGILSLTGLVTICQLCKRAGVTGAIRGMSLGILLSLFVAGWSLPQLNSYLGWKELCAKAKELSGKYRVSDYRVYHISRAENMDVYLGKDVIEAEEEDILRPPTEGQLILLRTKEIYTDSKIRRAIRNKEQYRIGNYTIVLFK